jgi:hypothetical protein
MERFGFCMGLLTAFCEDGIVCGITVHPPSSPIKTEKDSPAVFVRWRSPFANPQTSRFCGSSQGY